MSDFISTVSFTRPNNATPYTANDVVGPAAAALTLNATKGDSGRVIAVVSSVLIQYGAFVSGETSFNLHLYNATPPSALADNAAFDLPSGDRSNYLGFIPLGTIAAIGTSSAGVATNNIWSYLPVGGYSQLFAYLQTVGAWTPVANTVFSVSLFGQTV